MRLNFSIVKNFTVALLLLLLGGVAGYRYSEIGFLPFGVKIPFLSESTILNGNGSALSQINGNKNNHVAKEADFDVFWEVWTLLERDYLDQEKIDASKMVDGAISGMTSSLEDPYTVYLPPKNNQRSGEDLAGSFYGVGIELGYINETLAVISPLEGTPADKAGIKAGDLIIHVKDAAKDLDEDTNGWSLSKAVEEIRGKKDTEVILTLFRENHNDNNFFEVPIKRGEVVVKSVELEFIEHNGKKVAHLRLMRFGERTNGEWDQLIREIVARKDGIDGIVFDMRNNPGGFFDTSIDVASEFIKKGTVVSQKGRFASKDFKAKGNARLASIPTIVLVNRGSASAAEIVAGALRDNLGIKLVGEKTFGKGTVQDRREVSNGGGLHVTIGRWILPKGDWIHDEGIPVDVEVQDDFNTEEDEVLLRGIEEL